MRYLDFTEVQNDDDEQRINAFNGYGAVVGLEARRQFGSYFAVFGRLRGSILMDDKTISNDGGGDMYRLLDVNLTLLEIAAGAEFNARLNNGSLVFVRGSVEYQDWMNFSSSYDFIEDEDEFDGQSDVGVGGVGLSIGIRR